MAWSEEHEATLMELFESGLSPGKIARKLGAGYTRNAVIGKLDRLNGNRSKRRRSKAPAMPEKSGAAALTEPASPARIAPPEPAFTPRDVTTALPPLNLTLLQLTSRTCKWPSGFSCGEQRFCGLPQEKAVEPYCKDHGELAFSPSALRIKWDRSIRRNGATRR